jgi:ligand-binding SRPBCC domain-containing protein
MVRGSFRRFCHDHYFEGNGVSTRLKDVMEFEAPWGVLGILVERLALKQHMQDLLRRRNQCIRKTAESADWQKFVPY